MVTLFFTAITCLISFICFRSQKWVEMLILNPYRTIHNTEFHRMLSSGFLHANFGHLLFNMLAFYSFGLAVENYYNIYSVQYGIYLYTAMYLGGIIFANISTVIKFRNKSWYNSLGASGGVSAVVFAMIIIRPYNRDILLLFFPVPLPNLVFGGLYLLYCVYMARTSKDNINHDAHFYGAVWGILFTLMLRPNLIEGLFNY